MNNREITSEGEARRCAAMRSADEPGSMSKTEVIIGRAGVEALARAHVLVIGCGGVGSSCVEALARGGVGTLSILDRDIVAESNINRQAIAFHSTIGRAKVDVMRDMVLDINPDCNVETFERFLAPEDVPAFLDRFRILEGDVASDEIAGHDGETPALNAGLGDAAGAIESGGIASEGPSGPDSAAGLTGPEAGSSAAGLTGPGAAGAGSGAAGLTGPGAAGAGSDAAGLTGPGAAGAGSGAAGLTGLGAGPGAGAGAPTPGSDRGPLTWRFDWVIDAVDTISVKLALAAYANEHDMPLVASMGGGNKLDPTCLAFADLYDTVNCPLCRIMRKEGRKRGIRRLPVLYSSEVPARTETAPGTTRADRSDLGTMSYFPPIMGQMLAGWVIRQIVGLDSGGAA